MTSRNKVRDPVRIDGGSAAARAMVAERPSTGARSGKPKAPPKKPSDKASSKRPAGRPRQSGAGIKGGADLGRIAELKLKLGDEDYMNGAILRIATVLSARLTLR